MRTSSFPSALKAKKLMHRLREARTSPTVLYYLRLPSHVLARTELGELLLGLCDECHVDVRTPPDHEFFAEVNKQVAAMSRIPGSFFIVDRVKDQAIARYRESLLARRRKHADDPYMYMGGSMPFCFQTLRDRTEHSDERSESLFVIHSSPEEGLHQAVDMLAQGQFYYDKENTCVRVSQVYEHRLHDHFIAAEQPSQVPKNRLGYIMIDWEVKESEVRGRLTPAQLGALYEEFPRWFYDAMLRDNHVARDAVVTATVKRKTRAIPPKKPGGAPDVKHSMHVLYNVCGVPCTHLQFILRNVLRRHAADIRLFKDKDPEVRASAFVDKASGEDRIGECPFIGFDFANITGRTGIAMLGSRKSAGDPHSALVEKIAFSEGSVHVFPYKLGVENPMPFRPAPVDGQHDLAKLSKADAVHLMYSASCSVPKDNMVCPTRESMERSEVQQSRTAVTRHATSGKGVGPPARGGPGGAGGSVVSLLPEFMRAYFTQKRCTERPTSAICYASEIKKMGVKDADPDGWMVTHVFPGGACIAQLSVKDRPSLHEHSSNGTILALNTAIPGVVFMRCTQCSKPGDTSEHVDRVRNACDCESNWYRVTAEGFERAIQDAESKTKQMQRSEDMVRRVNAEEHKRKRAVENAKSVNHKKKTKK